MTELQDGVTELKDGAIDLEDGAYDLFDGTKDLKKGVEKQCEIFQIERVRAVVLGQAHLHLKMAALPGKVFR